ncbi:MAG: tetratricopeptide repeat protein [Limisphaerales bacterium]
MNPKALFPLLIAAVLLALPASAQTNSSTTNSDALVNGYLQIQEQLHATRMAIEDGRVLAADDAKRNAEAIAARLEALEQSVAAQHNADAETARKTQQFTLLLAGAFGLAGLGIVALLFYFQWRAFSQLAQISAQHNAVIANAGAVHQLAAPGRAAVASSNSRLLDVVGQLERKIIELENGSSLLAGATGSKSDDLLAEGEALLDAGQPHKALEVFDRLLATHPDHAEGLVKKSAALEKLGRLPEALGACDRAIARDGGFTLAFLQKGGLLNKLNRHDEALNCFEQVLLAQKKKAKFS